MSRELRPPRGISIVNTIARPLLAAGLPMGFNGLLTTTGRKTGRPRTTPLAIIEVAGRRWVWAPWGEVHWVRNLRASNEATIERRGRRDVVHAVELGPAQRIEFFRDTLDPLAHRIPFGRWFIRVMDGVDLEDPVQAAEGRAVFELHPAG